MSAAVRSTLPNQHRVSVPGTRPPTPAHTFERLERYPMITTDLCMHELDPSTCSVCKYANMPPVYVFGRSAHYHATADCTALEAEQAGVKKRGGTMTAVAVARPGSTVLDGRTLCTVCS